MSKVQKQEPFVLGGVEIAPGSIERVHLPVGTFLTHEQLMLQVTVIHGRLVGPTLLISGCIHGDEFNGAEIVRRILRTKSVQKLRGTLLAVPIVNRPGFVRRARYMPDRRDLNRLFPGSSTGSLGARLAKVMTDELIKRSDYVIDLHTGAVNRPNLPQIRVTAGDEESLKLAQMFSPPVILTAAQREQTLRSTCINLHKPVLLYESGEALRLNASSIRFGVQGILSVMQHLGMLARKSKRKERSESIVCHKSYWERAPEGGIFTPLVALGKAVEKGTLLGFIADPQGTSEVEVRSSYGGVVIGRTNEAVADEGDGLFHIAATGDTENVEDLITQSTEALPELAEDLEDHPVGFELQP